jgi:hypothetical protein
MLITFDTDCQPEGDSLSQPLVVDLKNSMISEERGRWLGFEAKRKQKKGSRQKP